MYILSNNFSNVSGEYFTNYSREDFSLIFYINLLQTFTSNKASPIKQEAKTTTTEKANLQGKYFDEIMKELNEALKEKAAEERKVSINYFSF